MDNHVTSQRNLEVGICTLPIILVCSQHMARFSTLDSFFDNNLQAHYLGSQKTSQALLLFKT